MKYCDNCFENHDELLKTAYGNYFCMDCWDEYINSDAGAVEYFIGICTGDYPVSEFDADFLGRAATSYKNNVDLLDLTTQEKAKIEQKAHELGLL